MKKKFEMVIAVLGIVIIILSIMLYKKATIQSTPAPVATGTPITITDKNITETNFKATVSVVAGSGLLATSSQEYIDQALASFKKSADEDVPKMRADFGADSPTAQYETDLKAKYIKSSKTDSVVISQYTYTGGANGDDSYKVFTQSLASGKMLLLSDVIASTKEDAFAAYVKKALLAWRPEGATESVVFPEDVAGLSFDAFTNWSYDDKNIVIYFDKFAVGPGVLGAVAFPVPLSKIGDMLQPAFK